MPLLEVLEQNGVECAACPNCSRMYPLTDEKGETLDLPGQCKRCGCPMDSKAALAFADEQAANYGKGLEAPPKHRQIRTGQAITK
mgnify:CR=1 FL=1